MKQLILGIDGGDLEVFKQFEMPFLHSLIKENESIKLTEDLFSRGWVEIISGKHAREHNGFYIMPKLDGTHDFTLSYSYNDLKEFNSDPLIWELAEKCGYKVGVMNVPTTYPAPKVDGFFVSGAGGGLYKVDGIPEEMCSDTDVRDILEQNNYILELRFKPSGITDVEVLVDSMNNMMEKRFKSFESLIDKNTLEFSFLALRATANLSYVLMYNIFTKHSNTNIQNKIASHFQLLDTLIKRLFNRVKPENFCITADHGLVPQKYHVNYNNWLLKNGYLSKNNSFISTFKYNVMLIRKFIKNPLGYTYVYPPKGEINWSKTQVFGSWYSNAIYINDKKRFNGIVSEDNMDGLVDEVCERFNNDSEVKKYNMTASPYRRNYKDAKFYDTLPDIWIDAPDEMFFLGQGQKFINESPWYKEIKSLKNIPTSMFTGTKGRHPICIMNKELSQFIKEDDEKDLTLVYKVTQRFFESIKK